jgi:Uma2 family endonuclease
MSAVPQTKWTPEEYLAFERVSEIKHEYFNGEIFAMTGSSRNHNRITIKTGTILLNQLGQRRCDVFASDMRVKIKKIGKYTYPDVSVVCGEPEFEDQEVDTLLNPNVIIEVLSPSIENCDRGKKFQHYRTIESLQEYLLISQDSVSIEHYVRQGEKWVLTDAKTLDTVLTLPSIDCTLALADVYEKVEFEEEQGE